jgi:PEP-CTERM motif
MKTLVVLVGLLSATAFGSPIGACDNGTTNTIDVYTNVTLTRSVLPADTADSCVVGGVTVSDFQVSGGSNAISNFTFDVGVSGNQLEFAYTNLGPPPVSIGSIQIYYTVTGGLTNMGLGEGTASYALVVVCSTPVPEGACGGAVLNENVPFAVSGGGVGGEGTNNSAITPASIDYVWTYVGGGNEILETVATPEPTTSWLMAVGLLGLGLLSRKLRN